MTHDLSKHFEAQNSEAHWSPFWEAEGLFCPVLDSQHPGEPYSIVIPPPNVTGSLHMGHALEQTLIDVLIRTHRLLGFNTLWQVGTDHAGIATQMVVERLLMQEGVLRQELGREAFVERIWAWKQTSGDQITRQMRRLGASVDWETEKFTMDADLSEAVQTVFVQLYRDGLIYRGQRLVNWDPVLETAVSDLEVESQEEEGYLWYIRYALVDPKPGQETTGLIVATTRPETLFGDLAVAVHPLDPRYQHLIGAQVRVPESDRVIPIIADESIDPNFGTGCVKITPAHDFNDYEIGRKHGLGTLNILMPDGRLNHQVPEPYRHLDRFSAREKLLQALENSGCLEKTQAHVLKVPRGDKTGSIIEPFLTDQWFLKTQELAKPAVEAVLTGQIKFMPAHWEKTYLDWMNNIQDWCISRQIWWGHRIPAWYDESGQIYVGKTEAEVRKHYQLDESQPLTQDSDVLDTWFSSALWPFATLGWPDTNNPRYQAFYPTSVLVTGFDIIFFWVARMIMMGLYCTGQVPFKVVFIHGLVQDQNGQKMSKSKGNVIDPIDVIQGIEPEALLAKRTQGLMQPQQKKKIESETKQQFPKGIPAQGTDALRFAFCALANQSRFIKFDLGRVEGYKHFANKIWNAARFIQLQLEHWDQDSALVDIQSLPNLWILSLWQNVKQRQREYLQFYRFDALAQNIYEFVWDEFCDWYIELSKPLLKNQSTAAETQFVLQQVFREVLIVLHPIMPYITEELWQVFQPKTAGKSIMQAAYPLFDALRVNQEAEQQTHFLKELIQGIRQVRSSLQIPPSQSLKLFVSSADGSLRSLLDALMVFIKPMAKIHSVEWVESRPTEKVLSLVFNALVVYLSVEDLIDIEAEKKRLEKQYSKMQADIDQIDQRLNNPNYLMGAKPAVIESERIKLNDYKARIEIIEHHLSELSAIMN